MSADVPIEVARAEWLRLMIPQLWESGFDRLAAEYSVELDRLERRRTEADRPPHWSTPVAERDPYSVDSQGRRAIDVLAGVYDDDDS